MRKKKKTFGDSNVEHVTWKTNLLSTAPKAYSGMGLSGYSLPVFRNFPSGVS